MSTLTAQRIAALFWRWFSSLAGPKQFFYTFNGWVKYLGAVALLLFVVGAVWGLVFSPKDFLQGHSVRIMYIHVPTASAALSVYLAMALMSISALVWKIKVSEWMVRALCVIGAVLCFLALVTGALWGKPTWGAFWVWDGRLTSMLILFFLYLGVLFLFLLDSNAKLNKPALYLAVIGAINLPIIKYSVVWWNSLHQVSSISASKGSSIHPSMLWPLLLMIFAFYFLSAALTLYSVCTLILQRERQQSWVKQYLAQR